MSYKMIAVLPEDEETFVELLDGRSRVAAFHRMVEREKAEREIVKRIQDALKQADSDSDAAQMGDTLGLIQEIVSEYLGE